MNTAHTIDHVLAKVKDIAVLPQVVFKIMETTGSDQSSAALLEREIIVDPGFSAKVLAQANSAFYGLPKKVTSIREAVMFLGFRQVRSLAMSVGVFDLFVGKTDTESLRRRSWWRSSVDTALCSKWLATRFNGIEPEEAYTCGLLHLIGKTLLDRFDSSGFKQIEEFIDQGVTDREAERQIYGCDHVQVALAVAKQWGFPETLVYGLNSADVPEQDAPCLRLRAAVAISHHIVERVVQSMPELNLLQGLPEWASEALVIPNESADQIIAGALATIAAASALAA